MKKILLVIIALAFICQAGYSQHSIDQLFKEFSKSEYITKISIGKMMMSFANMFGDTMGVDGIEIVEFGGCNHDVKERLTDAIRNVKDSSYETMINANENGSRVKVMVRIKDETIREMVVLTSGNEAALIRIKGKIKKSDIERIVSKHS